MRIEVWQQKLDNSCDCKYSWGNRQELSLLIFTIRNEYHVLVCSKTGVGFLDLTEPCDKAPFYANLVRSDGTSLYVTRFVRRLLFACIGIYKPLVVVIQSKLACDAIFYLHCWFVLTNLMNCWCFSSKTVLGACCILCWVGCFICNALLTKPLCF